MSSTIIVLAFRSFPLSGAIFVRMFDFFLIIIALWFWFIFICILIIVKGPVYLQTSTCDSYRWSCLKPHFLIMAMLILLDSNYRASFRYGSRQLCQCSAKPFKRRFEEHPTVPLWCPRSPTVCEVRRPLPKWPWFLEASKTCWPVEGAKSNIFRWQWFKRKSSCMPRWFGTFCSLTPPSPCMSWPLSSEASQHGTTQSMGSCPICSAPWCLMLIRRVSRLSHQ